MVDNKLSGDVMWNHLSTSVEELSRRFPEDSPECTLMSSTLKVSQLMGPAPDVVRVLPFGPLPPSEENIEREVDRLQGLMNNFGEKLRQLQVFLLSERDFEKANEVSIPMTKLSDAVVKLGEVLNNARCKIAFEIEPSRLR